MLRSLAVLATLAVLGTTASAQYTPSAGKSAPMERMHREVYDEATGATAVVEYEAKPRADKWGNAQGNQHDLAVDGAFKGQTVAVLHFYTDESFDFSLPKAALAEKGFSTYRWIGSPPSPAELEKGLAKASQLWIISASDSRLTPAHVAVIKKFFDAGHGVYIWGDNEPYYADANVVGRALLGAEMHGDTMGDHTVGMLNSKGGSGLVPNLLLTTGLENIYEGITIATIDRTPDMQPLIYGSAGNLVAAYYDKGGKRAIFDGGFTRLYMKWDTAGTARYVKNAASWLVNAERFGDSVINPDVKKPEVKPEAPKPVTEVPSTLIDALDTPPVAPPVAAPVRPHARPAAIDSSARLGWILLGLIAGLLVLAVVPRRFR
jgi:hypothetical protein